MAKTIMRAFRLHEISGVDRPAQAHAKVVIMKRQDGPTGLGPIIAKFFAKDADDGAVSFADSLAESEAQRAQWQAYDALCPLFDALRESMGSIAADATLTSADKVARIEESTGQFLAAVKAKFPEVEQEIGKAIAEVVKTLTKGASTMAVAPEVQKMIDEAVAKATAPLMKAAEAQAEELRVAKAKAEMTDEEKKRLAALGKAEADAFLAMTPEARKAEIAKAGESNPVIYKSADGTEYRKSDDPRLITMAKRDDEREKTLKAEVEKREIAEFEKRAGTELTNFAGDLSKRAAVLRHIDKADDETKKFFGEMLKAANAVLGKTFNPSGFQGGGQADAGHGDTAAAVAEMRKKAQEIAKRDNCSIDSAYDKAASENPELAAKLNSDRTTTFGGAN